MQSRLWGGLAAMTLGAIPMTPEEFHGPLAIVAIVRCGRFADAGVAAQMSMVAMVTALIIPGKLLPIP